MLTDSSAKYNGEKGRGTLYRTNEVSQVGCRACGCFVPGGAAVWKAYNWGYYALESGNNGNLKDKKTRWVLEPEKTKEKN